MADKYRQLQKNDCHDGGSAGGPYGCPCCRKISNLNKHKKLSRRLARHRMAQTNDDELNLRR